MMSSGVSEKSHVGDKIWVATQTDSFLALTSVLNDKLIYEIEMDVIAVYCEYE